MLEYVVADDKIKRPVRKRQTMYVESLNGVIRGGQIASDVLGDAVAFEAFRQPCLGRHVQ